MISARYFLPALFLISPLSAPAQDFGGDVIMTTMGNIGIQSAMRSSQRQLDRQRRVTPRSPAVQPRIISPAEERSLDYVVSLPNRKRNLAAFAAKSRATDPEDSRKMTTLFAANDVIGLADRDMRKLGLRADNVADAYALWWANAWLASRGRDDDLPPAQMRAISRQAAASLLATPEFANATNSQKQEMAEALIVQTILISSAVGVYKEQPEMMERLKAAVVQGAQASQLDLLAMDLTPAGFNLR